MVINNVYFDSFKVIKTQRVLPVDHKIWQKANGYGKYTLKDSKHLLYVYYKKIYFS